MGAMNKELRISAETLAGIKNNLSPVDAVINQLFEVADDINPKETWADFNLLQSLLQCRERGFRFAPCVTRAQ